MVLLYLTLDDQTDSDDTFNVCQREANVRSSHRVDGTLDHYAEGGQRSVQERTLGSNTFAKYLTNRLDPPYNIDLLSIFEFKFCTKQENLLSYDFLRISSS